jgi:thiamine-phosphate pyrophosphorylase
MSDDFSSRFETEARPPCQLYLISPLDVGGRFATRLESALGAGGVAAFQLRMKGASDKEIEVAAKPLQAVCAAHEVAFILNDNARLAHDIGADGVHLGQGDGEIAAARKLLGKDAQIGVTCHGSKHLAMEAGEAGADYVAFGAFFPTTTKQVEHYATPDILQWWATLFGIACVAVGGITPANARVLVEAQADFLAVSSAVWNAEDAAEAVRAFRNVMA